MFEIDAVAIINKIATQFNTILQEKNYQKEVFVGNERYFVENPLKPNQVGVVIEFGRGLLDFNQVVLPIDLTILSDSVDLDELQFLLYDFAINYSNTSNDLFYQRYSSPKINTNFALYNEEIRTVWEMSGTIRLVSPENAATKVYWKQNNEYVEIEILSVDLSLTNTPDPQPTLDSYGEAYTINRTSTFTISFSSYTSKNELYKSIINNQITPGSKNVRYEMKVDFGNGIAYEIDMVVVSVALKQNIGENGIAVITMAR